MADITTDTLSITYTNQLVDKEISMGTIETIFSVLPKRFQIPQLVDRLPKLADVVKEKSGESYYHRLVSHWKNPD